MRAETDHAHASRAQALSLEDEWKLLCVRHLPIAPTDSIWRYSRPHAQGDPEQGWKLHVSATVLTANEVLKRVATLLRERGIQFKAPTSLRELQRINCGIFYGYSQIGKFLTVYPRSPVEAVSLAARLHELTRQMTAPAVPFDLRFRPGSCVYYRYGSFKHLELENPDGTRTPAMRDPEGRLVRDARESETAKPDWVIDPFIEEGARCVIEEAVERDGDAAPVESPLQTTFRVFQALAQRGKGGVYKALDLSVRPPRLCILKEGRAAGELAWDKRDGRWRIRHEESVLVALRATGIGVPCVYSSFEVEGNYYLATELVGGQTLQSLLCRRRRRLRLSQALLYGVRLSSLIGRIHAAGWAWRDCKPTNIIVVWGGELRPLDFEGACLIEQPDPTPWGTTAFTPPAQPSGESALRSCVQDDLYALGVVIYLLLTGRLPERTAPVSIEKLRRNVPARVCEIVAALLDHDSRRRPDVMTVTEELTAELAVLGKLSPI
jgi:hypothetical protein